jgi:hypothetical protein
MVHDTCSALNQLEIFLIFKTVILSDSYQNSKRSIAESRIIYLFHLKFTPPSSIILLTIKFISQTWFFIGLISTNFLIGEM